MKNKDLIKLLLAADPEADALICVDFGNDVDMNFKVDGVDPVPALNAVYVEASKLEGIEPLYKIKLMELTENE